MNASFELDEDELRRLGHEVVELMLEAVRAERSEPVHPRITGPASRELVDEPLPEEGSSVADLIALWRDRVLPHARRNGHPRFFGYVCTSADPVGMLADAVASAMNQPVTAWRSSPGPAELERLAVRWLDELVGFGGGGSGLLVSGGSLANLHGLACAVTEAERRAALPEGSRGRLTAYLSREGHVSLRKALFFLGLPRANVRVLDIDDRRRLRVDELCAAIARDRAAGLTPAVVAATSGTANTGAIDPLEEIVSVCSDEKIWLHIDGAYGAPAVLAQDYRWMGRAFAAADSLSVDPHKWLFAPVDAGCILVRDPEALRRTFSEQSEYTTVSQTDPIEQYAFFDHGLELSRRFRGLKVWSILKARGRRRLAAAIQLDIDLRKHLDARVESSPRLEALGSELSIACFRYVPAGTHDPERLNLLNRTILETLVAEGRCYMSPTELDGRYALRACIVNFRTTTADVDFLLDEVTRVADGLSGRV